MDPCAHNVPCGTPRCHHSACHTSLPSAMLSYLRYPRSLIPPQHPGLEPYRHCRALLTDQLPLYQGLSVCIPGIPSPTMGQGMWLYPSRLSCCSWLAPYSHSLGRQEYTLGSAVEKTVRGPHQLGLSLLFYSVPHIRFPRVPHGQEELPPGCFIPQQIRGRCETLPLALLVCKCRLGPVS